MGVTRREQERAEVWENRGCPDPLEAVQAPAISAGSLGAGYGLAARAVIDQYLIENPDVAPPPNWPG